MGPKDADRLENRVELANSVDPDQTAPRGSGSTLFAQACLSKNIGLGLALCSEGKA